MRARHTVFLSAIATFLAACAPQSEELAPVTRTNFEGLQEVSSRYFDGALVRPGVDFASYSGLLVHKPELAFRTPDRSQQQFPLTEEQKSRFQDLLEARFQAEFVKLENLEVTDNPGPGVLDLHVRVQDILATVPPRTLGRAGRGGLALQALGEATLVIELRDAESEEVLARVFDSRAIQGVAIAQGDTPITRWEDVEKICDSWASTVRARLDVVVSGDY